MAPRPPAKLTSSTRTSCPACGGVLADWPLGPGLRLLRCTSCGSAVSANEAPHEDAYLQPSSRRLSRGLGAVLALGVRDQLRALGPLPPQSRILDLGAGDGRLAAALAERGHSVTAVEPVRNVAAAAGVPNVTVLRGRIEDLDLPEGSFDVAILWHVLEHLSSPVETLGRVRGWIAGGGRLVVAVPNLASWQARLGGRGWFHLDPARHVVHLTPAGLEALLERSGFSKSRRRSVFFDQALPGMWMTLLERSSGRSGALRVFVRREPTTRKDIATAAVLAAPALVAAIPFELAASAAGRGGVIVVEAGTE